ncbi:universal stress protein [Cognatishimia sp. F0-27]|uniref:universal stress protein n=1 Tax=Cognatishimia sp. F0-27 TaxID=2816855 RepID=UPI001D0C74BE|nr:universal stress protein [Cognatishimia sp. F0-27]MCC1491699.1 universal stress protein [Cognatishimia sp. F0-27]
MSYKTIFTAVSDTELLGPVLDKAVTLTQGFEAHLDVLAVGVDRTQTGYYYAGANAMVLQESLNRASDDAKALSAAARKQLEKTDCRWAIEDSVAQIADVGRHVAARARYSDLVVLPRPYGKGRGIEMEPIIEGAMFEGQTPVLVLPDEGTVTVPPRRILMAWNESPEALRAMRAAIPLMQEADVVHVVVIDPPSHGADRSDPGGRVAQYLSRHGMRVEIDVLSKSLPRVSDVLSRHVVDMDADMIVMGAYGHSRFREAILGGATRNMLEKASVPVFMAH